MTNYMNKLKIEQMNLSGIPLPFIYQKIHEDDKLEQINSEIKFIYDNLGIQIIRKSKKYLDVTIYKDGQILDKIEKLLYFPINVFLIINILMLYPLNNFKIFQNY